MVSNSDFAVMTAAVLPSKPIPADRGCPIGSVQRGIPLEESRACTFPCTSATSTWFACTAICMGTVTLPPMLPRHARLAGAVAGLACKGVGGGGL